MIPNDSQGITMAAVKYIYKMYVDHYKKTGEHLNTSATDIANEYDLWLGDDWYHLGHTIVTCLDNLKLIESYHKGNPKIIDVLLGKTIKAANMTVDPELIKKFIPLVIDKWFPKNLS